MRKQCWRNINVAAINAGLVQGVFSLQPGGNWWPAGQDCAFYDFAFAPGLGAVTRVRDIGFGELEFTTVLCANTLRAEVLRQWKQRPLFPLGEIRKQCYAEAIGWLERLKGAWLQTVTKVKSWNFTCHKIVVPAVLGAASQPLGYADHGPVMGLLSVSGGKGSG
jgi:hypothetical protein